MHPLAIHILSYFSKAWAPTCLRSRSPKISKHVSFTEALRSIFTSESKSRIQKTHDKITAVCARPFGGLFIHCMSKKSQGYNAGNWEEKGLLLLSSLTSPWALPEMSLHQSAVEHLENFCSPLCCPTVGLQKASPHVLIKMFLHFSDWNKDKFYWISVYIWLPLGQALMSF